jgi:hypothetical protein
MKRPVLYALEYWTPSTKRWRLGHETYYPRSVAERKARRSETALVPIRIVPLYRGAGEGGGR